DMPAADAGSEMDQRLAQYTTVRLTTDMSALSDREQHVLSLLIDAADEMNEIYWQQAYGSRDSLLSTITDDATRQYVMINYGPWDRIADNEPFIEGVGPKPPGANFYPVDMTQEEFERAAAGANGDALRSLYTIVRRGTDGSLEAVPYHVAFREPTERAAAKLREAATYADDPGLRRYLELRADALLSDDYRASDMAWLDMKDNTIDVIIGPIETYEDQLFGYKASHEGLVLVKDREWSERLSRYAAMLPALQQGLPVDAKYRAEQPGTDSDL